MALPTPLTPAQVGGSNDASELRASFVTGPNAGMVLLVSKTDPNLASAVIAGDVVVEDPGEFTETPSSPVLSGISPITCAVGDAVTIILTGTGLSGLGLSGEFSPDGQTSTDSEFPPSTSTRVEFPFPDTVFVTDGVKSFEVYENGNDLIGSFEFTVTPAAL